ncbi:hypothetical protein [Kribbella kalugense]|nr:hypothetical protein [Kribbella kalugense]
MPVRIAGDLVSIAGLRGRCVFDRTGRHVGRLADLVVRLDIQDPHPPIQGALVRAGSKLHYIPETAIAGIRDWNLFLCTVGLASRTIPANDLFVRLAHHVGLSAPSRISDIILACSIDGIRLVGIDTSVRTLLRRLVPGPSRRTVSPHRLQPWPLLDAPMQSKSRETPPRLASPLLPRAGRPTSTPPYTPYTRRTATPTSG